MGIRKALKKASDTVINGIAAASALSPSQLDEVAEDRNRYLSQMPSKDDPEAIETTARYLGASAVEIFNAYLPQIHELYLPVDEDAEYDGSFDRIHNVRFIHLTRWVSTKDENALDKLVNVYEVLSDAQCNIALVFHRSMVATDVYLAVTDVENSSDNVDVNNYMQRLLEALRGNFPGSEWEREIGEGRIPCVDRWTPYSVAAVSNLPTEKSEKFVSQTIDKLLDGVVPNRPEEEYTLILLATPVDDARERQTHLGEIYSALAPMAEWQTSYTYNENNARSSQATAGVNLGVSIGSQVGQSTGISDSAGTSDSTSENESESTSWGRSDSRGHSEGTSKSQNDSAYGGVSFGTSDLLPFSLGGNAGGSHSTGSGTSTTTSQTATISNTLSKTLGKTLSRALSRTLTTTSSVSSSQSMGANFGLNFARSSSVMTTVGKGEQFNQSFKNYTVKHALEQLEEQMKRIDTSLALGMWDFAAYVVSEDSNVANNVAHSYLALTQGEESFLSESAINLWRGNVGEEAEVAQHICSYLRDLRHPLFGLNPSVVQGDSSYYVYPQIVSATTSLSGKELAYSLNFPKKSVAGLPVFECAEFARNVSVLDDDLTRYETISLGNIYHMHHVEPTSVDLSLPSLASHTFITGSTGAGKTNTTALILERARSKGIKFLVVEPAKGEYKDLFGSDPDVSVYGTNPDLTPLLRVNPFSFPAGIHILEHLDRLVEIFNVCWPMYAAMPAVLKDAIQKSYEDCGWNLTTSANPFGRDLYPNFRDVERNIRTIIESSEYDEENKGAYKGSLITRVASLSNGINKLVFTEDELSEEELFDHNVIVDLSRVGSSETKSLLMGLMVLKLQEHRMATSEGSNLPLRHLTVLEEAHNLLKRTSTEQPVDGGNLIGKSVEMLSNAIAEMRTYGEGFIIADQAPGLLDLSVIRNTNTKIIMRLPDFEDRKLVGYAASLNDDQIRELAKLPRGVAAVYQNNWIEAVLCKIDHADLPEVPYRYEKPKVQDLDDGQLARMNETRLRIADLIALNQKAEETELRELGLAMRELNLNASLRAQLLSYVSRKHPKLNLFETGPLMRGLFPNVREQVVWAHAHKSETRDMTDSAKEELRSMFATELIDRVERVIIQSIITEYLCMDLQDVEVFKDWRERGGLA